MGMSTTAQHLRLRPSCFSHDRFLSHALLPCSACHNHQHHLTSWADKGQLQGRSSRSSLHYDCHANLLCVVTGSKRVHLVHPDLTPCVYPLPLWGQSSNHSAVDFAQPDAVKHPRFQEALQAQQSFDLQVSGSCVGLAQALAQVWLNCVALFWL